MTILSVPRFHPSFSLLLKGMDFSDAVMMSTSQNNARVCLTASIAQQQPPPFFKFSRAWGFSALLFFFQPWESGSLGLPHPLLCLQRLPVFGVICDEP
jgi:hypothetical protein